MRHPILLWDDWEVMLIAWQSGQITPIHDHRGVMGGMVVLSGTLAEERFTTPNERPELADSRVAARGRPLGHRPDARSIASSRRARAPSRSTSTGRRCGPWASGTRRDCSSIMPSAFDVGEEVLAPGRRIAGRRGTAALSLATRARRRSPAPPPTSRLQPSRTDLDGALARPRPPAGVAMRKRRSRGRAGRRRPWRRDRAGYRTPRRAACGECPMPGSIDDGAVAAPIARPRGRSSVSWPWNPSKVVRRRRPAQEGVTGAERAAERQRPDRREGGRAAPPSGERDRRARACRPPPRPRSAT